MSAKKNQMASESESDQTSEEESSSSDVKESSSSDVKESSSSDVKEVINTLSKNRQKLRDWMEKAIEFYTKGNYNAFEEVLMNAISHSSNSYAEYQSDLLRALSILTGHLVYLACNDPGKRRTDIQGKVANLMTIVDSLGINVSEENHLLCRGFALMLINRLPEADNCFVAVLRQTPNDVAALIGRGCLAYNRQEYHMALRFFKQVLLDFPQGPLDVRVGIGHCFLKLGALDSAYRAFQLALHNNERCLSALLGLAQLKLNECTLPSNQAALKLLCAAYTMNQHHPLVLSWMTGHLYYQRDYEKLRVVAGNAYIATEDPQLKAQNSYQIARAFHAQQNFAQAFAFYGRAVSHSASEFAPPHLGLAQMYVHRGQLDKAENSLRMLLKLLPQQTEALRMLATLFAQSDAESKCDMAIHLFKKAASEDDCDTWLGLAAIYTRKQRWSEAIESYDHAVRIYQKLHETDHDVPLIWLNNMAALQMHAGNPKAALQTLDKALAMTPDATEDKYESNLLTLRFNRARVLEQLQLDEQAETSYQQLILDHPNYYDSYLRLGALAQKRNQIEVAQAMYEAVLKLDSGNEAANIHLGNFHYRQDNMELAMTHYGIIQRNTGVEDCYMLIAMGNLGLVNLQRSIHDGDQETAKEQLENALQLYRQVLDDNQHNLWAANGIGVALGCSGNLSEAEAIFKQITESTKRCPEALLNAAHVALQQEHYSEAVDLYHQYLKELPGTNCIQAMQLLAKSLVQAGRTKESKEWLQKARHVAPQDVNVLYNLAVVMKREVSDSFGTSGSNLVDLQRAESDLKLAKGYFSFLGQQKEPVHSSKSQVDLCSQILENAPAELKSFRKQERQLKREQLKKIEQSCLKSRENELFSNPHALEREPSTKYKRSHRESSKSKKSDDEQCHRKSKSKGKTSTSPINSDAEQTIKLGKTDTEATKKSLEDRSRKTEREPSTRTSHREHSTRRKRSYEESSKKQKTVDEESTVTKQANVDKEDSTESTKKEEKNTTPTTKEAIKPTEKPDKKLSLKKDESTAASVSDESKNISPETPDKPKHKPKHKSKKRKHGSKEKCSSEPKHKKKK